MVLVPELVLTPQMMRKFSSYFGQEVAMLHSGLRMTERYDQWKRIRRGEARVVLGTRSAVFALVSFGKLHRLIGSLDVGNCFLSKTSGIIGKWMNK